MSNMKKIKVKKKKEEEKADTLTLMVRESLNSMGKRVAPAQEQLLVGIYKLFLVGGVSNIIDFFLFMILAFFVKIDALYLNAIVFVVVLVYGLWMSFKYMFPKGKEKKPLIQYLILMFVGFLITEGILFGLVSVLKWNSILVKLLCVILVIFIRWGMKKLLFEHKKTSR